MIPAKADRSFYAPRPFNYPGLLPRFGGEDNSPPPAPTTTTQRPLPQRPLTQRPQFAGDTNTLGTRFGEGAIRVNPNYAPCYECFLYVTRDGYVLKVTRDSLQ
ncbi:hypothetical protein J437_LFUL014664 [Ladona fulva]|uniref:Uncharacterized protein n=1 Tax=Ladona fulva TaxID=123851 RepID=A0A8K0KEY5_LADFU|nr:hypothetical protein J437_LFUL014664 [Ladona fulva]